VALDAAVIAPKVTLMKWRPKIGLTDIVVICASVAYFVSWWTNTAKDLALWLFLGVLLAVPGAKALWRYRASRPRRKADA
jgi:hypothetical protein